MENIFKNQLLTSAVIISAVIIAAGLALSGCSSSGGESSVISPNGIYTGTVTGANTGANGDEKAIIYNNRMIVMSPAGDFQQVFDSTLSVENKKFTTTSSVYYGGLNLSSVADLSTTGTFEPEATLNASFADTNTVTPSVPSGTISLNFDGGNYNKTSSLSLISGTWTGPFGNFATATLTVDPDGSFTGSDDSIGCMFTGNVIVPDASINVYNISVTTAISCLSLSIGNYTGLAWIEGASNNTLYISFSNDTNNRTMTLTK